MNARTSPLRVFISYARKDGEGFATRLRERLEAVNIPCWMDRIGLEGGQDWWQQIIDALNQVEFLVLVMTPFSLISHNVRREWRYARQRGVCVYPVIADPALEFDSLPRWMGDEHFYDLDHEWTKFVNDLNTRCDPPRVPFMAGKLHNGYVERSDLFTELISKLIDENRQEPIAATIALHGTSGFGKTTLAIALCQDERIQDAFHNAILWVELGKDVGNLVGKVNDLIKMLSREQERADYIDLVPARTRLAELLNDHTMLIVIDDVWKISHLEPFLEGGRYCARLITTRNSNILPEAISKIAVESMKTSEAIKLLATGLTEFPKPARKQLAARLGKCPLTLARYNSILFDRVTDEKKNQKLDDAIRFVNKLLEKHGLHAFDYKNPEDAVTKRLETSLELLSENERERYRELAIFPEAIDIPLSALEKLWSITGELDDTDTEQLCERLYDRSLLLKFDLDRRSVRLHDLWHQYLAQEQSDRLSTIHGKLLNAFALQSWTALPPNELYLWKHLAHHLIGAGREAALVATLKDLQFLVKKTFICKTAAAAELDLNLAEKYALDDDLLYLLRRQFILCGHLLSGDKRLEDLSATLYSRLEHFDGRLQHLKKLDPLTQELKKSLVPPYLAPRHPLPDLPHPLLKRTLSQYESEVTSCAMSTDGTIIVSTHSESILEEDVLKINGVLKIWDAYSGVERLTILSHRDNRINCCAISEDNDWVVTASDDQTLKVWDAESGEELLYLAGHTGRVNSCAISPDGKFIVSASSDQTVKKWDIDISKGEVRSSNLINHTDEVLGCAVSSDGKTIVFASKDKTLKAWELDGGVKPLILVGHDDEVNACAISRDKTFIVSASNDKTLKVWNTINGNECFPPLGHSDRVNACTISSDGAFIVSASSDKTLKLWNAKNGKELQTWAGHERPVSGCAISPDGKLIISGSWDGTIKHWEPPNGTKVFVQSGHVLPVKCCAVSQNGECVISGSEDKTLKIWDAKSGSELRTLNGHEATISGCAVNSDGTLIVTASDKTLRKWDFRSETEGRLTLIEHSATIMDCKMTPDGKFIVSASYDGKIKIWEAGSENLTIDLKEENDPMMCCTIFADRKLVAAGSKNFKVLVWDFTTGEFKKFYLNGHNNAVSDCAFSPDGQLLVSASWDKTLKIWNLESLTKDLDLSGHSARVNGCAISHDGAFIASVSDDKTIKIWDFHGNCKSTLYVDRKLHRCAWFEDNEHLVAVGDAGVYFLKLVK